MRKEYAISVQMICQHGARLFSSFVLAETKAKAISQGVELALSSDEAHGNNCVVSVTGTSCHEASSNLLRNAVEELNSNIVKGAVAEGINALRN